AIDFPETVTAIGYSAFANCTKLKSITVHWTDAESLVTPESSAFDGIASDCLLTVPKGTLELYRNNPVWSKFLNIAVEPHEHDFSGIYVPNDADTHSKKCLYCDEYSDDVKFKHTFVDGACSVCGYRCKHNFEEDWGICTLCGQEEQAYINREWDAEKHIVVSHKETIPEIAKKITKDTTELTSGWYILCESVEIPEGKHITVNGDVHIVLYSGCELKIPAPESGYPGIQLSEGNSLTVYGRMDDTGSIVSYGDFGGEEHGGAGIGGLNIENAVYGIKSANSGTLNVCGGIVKAYGGSYASAIGGGYGGSGGEFNIYGGTVIAENVGLADGAGIGSGFDAEIYIPGDEGLELVETSAGIINIYDGTVTAKGRGAGAGIGGGNGADGGIVTIYGGDITAASGCGFVSGIGDGWAMTDDGVVRVDGGIVNVIPQTGTTIHVTRNNIELEGSPYSEATQIGGLLNYESIGDAADIMTPQVVKVTTENHIVTSLGAKIKTDTSSLRLGAFYNGKILDDEQREAVKDLGMIFYPKHLLGEETLNLDNTKAVRMSATGIEEFDSEKTFEDYETFTFYVTIVGIPENGWNTKIAFRPFIILGNGTIEYGEVLERCYNDVVAAKLK
ncbi:MAG: hypothetical protein KBS44_01575, partial [Clostridiales bacterium]|nr:hypothetical protein [Candidatus Coliplasma equi]